MSSLPVAYRAPGRKALAELTLLMRGEEVSEVTETPVLAGSTDIIVASTAPPEFGPLAFEVTPSASSLASILEWRHQVPMLPPSPACLTSLA
jgi:hypothetical protein